MKTLTSIAQLLRNAAFIVLFSISSFMLRAQNLVPNGDFEQYVNCPTSWGQLYNTQFWINPSTSNVQPDYFNQCGASSVSVPTNVTGFQQAHSGGAYVSIFLTQVTGSGRSYIEVPLVSPLIADTIYHFEMFVNLGNISQYTTDAIGVYFSNSAITNVNNSLPLPYTPQITNTTGNNPDSLSWKKVSGNYTSIGGESYIIIGNFKEDTNTTITVVNNGGFNFANCLIDDVSLVPIPPSVNLMCSDSSFCQNQCIDFHDLSTTSPTSWEWFFPGSNTPTSTSQNPINICYSSYGSFDVTLIACNAAGCDTLVLPGFINAYQIPSPTIIQSNDTLFSSPGIAYQWWNVDSGIIAGANDSYYITSQGGSYFVIVTDTAGCTGSSNTIVISSVNELAAGSSQLEIIPNPNTGCFTISLNQPIKDFSLRIINSMGQTLKRWQSSVGNGQLKIEVILANATAGFYTIELITNEKIYKQKFVKE